MKINSCHIVTKNKRRLRTTQTNCDEQFERKCKRSENLGLVFLVPVMFVGADVVHQVPLFILVFITIFSVLQEVKRLEYVARAPVQKKELSEARRTHTLKGKASSRPKVCASVCAHLLPSLRRSVPFIRCCRFLFSTEPFCSEADRPSRERTLCVRTSRMVSVYPTS